MIYYSYMNTCLPKKNLYVDKDLSFSVQKSWLRGLLVVVQPYFLVAVQVGTKTNSCSTISKGMKTCF